MTKLEIANVALTFVGATRITDFSSTNTGQVVDTLYPVARDFVLQKADWTAATTEAQLTQVASDFDEWDHAYLFPTTPPMIRLIEVQPTLDEKPDYEIANGKFYSNVDSFTIKYVYPESNPEMFSPMMALAVATYLAALLALPIMNSVEVQGKYEQLAEIRIRRAAHEDRMANDPDRGSYTDWTARA